MKLFKRIILAALLLCLALGIVGLVAACGDKKEKPIEYTVTVTCEEESALAEIRVVFKTDKGDTVKGGEATALKEGKATFTVVPDTYTVELTGVPEEYEYAPSLVTRDSPAATIPLTRKGGEEPSSIDYTITVTSEYAELLADVQVVLKDTTGKVVDTKSLEDGKATFTVLPGAYTVELTGIPAKYTYEAAELTAERHDATIEIVLYLPAGLNGTYTDEDRNGWTVTIDGTAVTISAVSSPVTATIVSWNEETKLLTAVDAEETAYTFIFCAANYALIGIGTWEGYNFYPEGHLPVATMPYSFPKVWYTDSTVIRETIEFKDALFTYGSESGTVYKTVENEDATWTFYAIVGAEKITLTWDTAEGALTLNKGSDAEIVFYSLQPEDFYELGLNGTWYADSNASGAANTPIALRFTAYSKEVVFALTGTLTSSPFPGLGKVTGYNPDSDIITIAFSSQIFHFKYDPITERFTDSGATDTDSPEATYGPYLHYTYDIDRAEQLPEWTKSTYATATGNTIMFSGVSVVFDGCSTARIRHYDEATKTLITLLDGEHILITWFDLVTYTMVEATYLKSGDSLGQYVKAPDAIDPELDWLYLGTWEDGAYRIVFNGVNVTFRSWAGYFTAHNKDAKTITIYFLGRGEATLTYADEANPRTLSGMIDNGNYHFVQIIPRTLPASLKGTWIGTYSYGGTTYKSIVTFDGTTSVQFSDNGGPTSAKTVTNISNSGDTWTFTIKMGDGLFAAVYNFTYNAATSELVGVRGNNRYTFVKQ